MLKREIEICGKKIPFRSSADRPEIIPFKVPRGIFLRICRNWKNPISVRPKMGMSSRIDDLEIFENVAYIMAYHADNSIPASIDDWLDQFDSFPSMRYCLQILELWGDNLGNRGGSKKRPGRSEREMTTPLFLLRSVEIGISISDLDLLTVGLVIDMWTEKANDSVKYNKIATQDDFDKF